MFLIAVGDRVAKIAWFPQPRDDGDRINWHTKNIAKLSGLTLPKRDSQIIRVDFEKQDISGHNVSRPRSSPELSIQHVPNAGSKT